MRQAYLLMGEIVRPQGIHGEVKLRHYTDDPERFQELQTLYAQRGEGYEPVRLTGARTHKGDVYLTLAGVSDRDAAEALRGIRLYVKREDARQLEEGEVFIAEILGATAYDTKGNTLGTLADVLTPGGVDVFVFDTPRGRLMMPAVGHVLLEMDAEAGRIVLDESRLDEVAVYEDRHS